MEIRLFRNDIDSQDDCIKIRKRHGRTDFLIRYTDGSVPNTVWVNEKSRDEVLEYIDQTLYFAMYDRYPFISIQVSIPGCPMFVLRHENLNNNSIDDIVRACESWIDNPGAIFTQ
jgi:hypothetical protein